MPRLDGINKYINHLISDSLFDEVVGDFNVAVEGVSKLCAGGRAVQCA